MHPDIALLQLQDSVSLAAPCVPLNYAMPACTAWEHVVHLLGLWSRRGAASGPACMETGSYISRLA